MHADVNGYPFLVLGPWDRFIERKSATAGFFRLRVNLLGFFLLGVFPHGR
jgi:hypothetical protein